MHSTHSVKWKQRQVNFTTKRKDWCVKQQKCNTWKSTKNQGSRNPGHDWKVWTIESSSERGNGCKELVCESNCLIKAKCGRKP